MEKLCKAMRFESGKYYRYEGERLDVYMEDTFYSENKEALSSSRTMGKSCRVGFLLEDLEDVTLDFGGATVVFHGRIVPFFLINCRNVTVKNLRIDYDRPFYTQAKVLDVKEGELTVRIDDGFDYEIRDGYLFAKSETWEKNLNRNDCLLWMFDREGKKSYPIILGLFGREIFPNSNPPQPIWPLSIEEKGDRQVIRGYIPKEWDYNDGHNSLLITHEIRDKNTFTIVGGEEITIENCLLIHGAAMGIMGMHTKNLTIDRYSMLRNVDGNGRLVTNNADAIHCFNCSGKIEIKNCNMEGLLDDTVNIHNNYFSVKKVEGQTLTMYSKAAGLSINCRLFSEGDRIRIYKGRTQEAVADLTIEKLVVDEENKVHVFTVKGDTSGISEEDTAENVSAQPEIYLHDCRFGTFRGTMRLQSRGKTVVENCVFENKEQSIIFTGDTTYWFESGPVNDITIRSCTFRNVGEWPRFNFFGEVEFTEKEDTYHKNILIEDCTFEGKGVIAALRHVENFTYRQNRQEDGCTITSLASKNVVSDIPVKEAE